MEYLRWTLLLLSTMWLQGGIIDVYGVNTPCRNPNGRWGSCVSIYQCESLSGILRDRIVNNYRFVRNSQCHSHDDDDAIRSPYVCCTSDRDFDIRRPTHPNVIFPREGYIIFPDNVQFTTKRALIKPTKEAAIETISTEGTNTESISSKVTSTATIPTAGMRKSKTLGQRFPLPPNCGSLTIANKIYGGSETDLGEFSWMVNLIYQTEKGELVSVCAGSIINEHYVLTAAHCVRGPIEQKVGRLVSVRIGDHNTATDVDCNGYDCLPPAQQVGFESITVHEHYDEDREAGINQHHDIALIRLDRSLSFSHFLEPTCLPWVEAPVLLRSGQKLTVAGWGHNGTVKYTAEKQKVVVPIVDLEECRELFANVIKIAEEQLCAGGVFREDSCTGDSGGPLMRLSNGFWVLEGIVSYGRRCGLEHEPAVYTKVSSYMDWIQRNVGP